MRVLLGQIEIAPGDLAGNAARMAAAIAAHPDASLAAFPELALGGYDLERVEATAVEEASEVFAPLQEAARRARTAIVVGFAERREDGIADSAGCIDCDGRWVATYRKLQLFGAEHEHFVPGDRVLVVELGGVRVAPMVCFDVEFPEPARAAAGAGAEALVTIAANMIPFGPDHALAVAARALDNRRPHLYVNRTGSEGGHEFAGRSAAHSGDGAMRARLGRRPALVTCELDSPPVPAHLDYLALRRPEPAVTTVGRSIPEDLTS